MTSSHSYFSSCALLLLLSLSLSWRASTGLPVTVPSAQKRAGDCPLLSKELLLNIPALLNNDIWHGATSDTIEVMSVDTALACTPSQTQNTGCTMERNTTFNESECLRNIMEDLTHFADAIQSYKNSASRDIDAEVASLNSTLDIIQNLRNCSLMPDRDNNFSKVEPAQMWGNVSFDNRLKMLKMMKGFYIRTITINRAMGYISSSH